MESIRTIAQETVDLYQRQTATPARTPAKHPSTSSGEEKIRNMDIIYPLDKLPNVDEDTRLGQYPKKLVEIVKSNQRNLPTLNAALERFHKALGSQGKVKVGTIPLAAFTLNLLHLAKLVADLPPNYTQEIAKMVNRIERDYYNWDIGFGEALNAKARLEEIKRTILKLPS